jgi:hypothetical protein
MTRQRRTPQQIADALAWRDVVMASDPSRTSAASDLADLIREYLVALDERDACLSSEPRWPELARRAEAALTKLRLATWMPSKTSALTVAVDERAALPEVRIDKPSAKSPGWWSQISWRKK